MNKTTNLKPIFVFDFDGVLLDSTDEIAFTGYCLSKNLRINSLEEVPGDYLKLLRLNRGVGRTINDLAYLSAWCIENQATLTLSGSEKILTPEKFEDFKNKKMQLEETRQLLSGKSFLELRSKIMLEQAELWLQLNKPYKKIWNYLREHLSPMGFCILSYKNVSALQKICDFYELNIASENIFSAYQSSKTIGFETITKKYPERNYYFFDDAPTNLLEVKQTSVQNPNLPINIFHAGWGDCTEDERRILKENNFTSLSQDETISLISQVGA